eukprot:13155537-Alexandrium_andersonii.AAC.1
MVRVADKRGQRVVPRLIAAGRLKLQTGCAQILMGVAWCAQFAGPPGMVAGQAAFKAPCRLRAVGLGPKGSAA